MREWEQTSPTSKPPSSCTEKYQCISTVQGLPPTQYTEESPVVCTADCVRHSPGVTLQRARESPLLPGGSGFSQEMLGGWCSRVGSLPPGTSEHPLEGPLVPRVITRAP